MPANGRWDLIRRLKVNNIVITLNPFKRDISSFIFLFVYPTSTRWWLICWRKHVVVYNTRLLFVCLFVCLFVFGAAAQRGPGPPQSRRFLDHTQRRTTVGRTPLDKWSVRRRDLYLTTHNNHNRLTSMPPVGFEPTISLGERPQTYALDRAATGTGKRLL